MTAARRAPTQREREGMDWWNSLTDEQRASWLSRPGIDSAAKAWARRQKGLPMHDSAILAEQSAHERRVVEERDPRPYDIAIVAGGAGVSLIREIAQRMEAEGDEPSIMWYRDEAGAIQGVKLVGHLSPDASTLYAYRPVTP